MRGVGGWMLDRMRGRFEGGWKGDEGGMVRGE